MEELKKKGNEEFKNKNFESAIEYYTQAMSIEPQNHILFSNRAQAFLKLQRFEDALVDIQKTIEINPTFIKVLLIILNLRLIKSKQLV
jgi:stress-induced-phosphoprotein 1